MSNVMTLAIQITAVDMLSSVVERIKQRVFSLGSSANKVKDDFDAMSKHITAGLKAVAVSHYALQKIIPGVKVAGDLQEAVIDVRLNLMEAGKSARDLDRDLAKVKSTAIDVSKVAPFSAQEVVQIENTFLKAGLSLKDVIAKGGAAWAATALATLSKEAPASIANAMVMMATPFNIKGGQFGELADWLQKVDAASVTTIPELMEGMKYVAGTASIMKVSWMDTIKALGVVAQSGLRGSMGGTSLNDFLTRLNGTSRETRKIMTELNHYLAGRGGAKLEFFTQSGKLKELPVIINDLRKAMEPLTDRQKMFVMEKIFGEQGARAALALIKEGEGSWENMGESLEKMEGLQAKMEERLKGFNANVKALSGTSKTTLATLFDPLLKNLTTVLSMLNDIIFKVGEIAEKKPSLAAAVSYGSVGLAGAAGLYGIYRLIRGGVAGSRVLKGAGGLTGLLKGLGGTAVGIAKGTAVEAATGVTPVYVTNAAEISSGGPEGIIAKMGGVAALFNPATIAAAMTAALAYMTYKNPALADMAEANVYGPGSREVFEAYSKMKPPEVNINQIIKIEDGKVKFINSDNMNVKTNIDLERGQFNP